MEEVQPYFAEMAPQRLGELPYIRIKEVRRQCGDRLATAIHLPQMKLMLVRIGIFNDVQQKFLVVPQKSDLSDAIHPQAMSNEIQTFFRLRSAVYVVSKPHNGDCSVLHRLGEPRDNRLMKRAQMLGIAMNVADSEERRAIRQSRRGTLPRIGLNFDPRVARHGSHIEAGRRILPKS